MMNKKLYYIANIKNNWLSSSCVLASEVKLFVCLIVDLICTHFSSQAHACCAYKLCIFDDVFSINKLLGWSQISLCQGKDGLMRASE